MVKNLPANTGDSRDAGSILWSGRSPREGNGIHSSILAWKIPWTEELAGYSPRGHKKSQTWLSNQTRTAIMSFVSLPYLPQWGFEDKPRAGNKAEDRSERLGKGTEGGSLLLWRGGGPSQRSREPCSPPLSPLPSPAWFLGLFCLLEQIPAMHLRKDNYTCIPGRDRPGVSREDSDVDANRAEPRHVQSTDSSWIKSETRHFSDQNFPWNSF